MAELFKAILNNNIPLVWLAVFLSLIPFFWSFSKFRHRRYQNKILLIAFIGCTTITLDILDYVSISVAFFLYALCVAYLFLTYYTARNLLFPESSPILLLGTLIREGNYDKAEKRFPQRPLYIRSVLGKIKWYLLNARRLLEQSRPREAYETYSSLLSLPLFEDEEIDIKLKQVLSLLLLGDTNRAQSIFKRIKDKSEEFRPNQFLCLQSLFYERLGEFEKAHQNLLAAIGQDDHIPSAELAKTYNNLGRMEKVLGNMTNGIHYYRKSAELACQNQDKNLIHAAYPNLIDIYLLINDNANAIKYYKKYEELIDKENIDDVLKFNNYRLEYARQTRNRPFYLKTLALGRAEILPRLTVQKRYVFEASELRIRWNSQCGWDEKMSWFQVHLTEYRKLDFPARYLTIKEAFNILYELAKMKNLGTFMDLFSKVLALMEQSKEEIDRYILALPDYCVFERCDWEKEQAFLRRIQKTDEIPMNMIGFYEGMFEHFSNIKAIQLQHGNPLAAIEADLNIADECMGLAQDIKEKDMLLYLQHRLNEHLIEACKDLEKFRGHPVTNEYALRIARYALFLDKKEMAKQYFVDFIQSKISINHYANWLQRYYCDLKEIFGIANGIA